MSVYFHTEDLNFTFNNRNRFAKWIRDVILKHKAEPGPVSVIFTSNRYIRTVNNTYLQHDHFTDVITFNYNEGKIISGDIFVSIEQVRINSQLYNTDFEQELARVVIHGVLHLLGFNDSNQEERKEMRTMEDEALKRLSVN